MVNSLSVRHDDLALAIEIVRHRGLQKRIDKRHPDKAKVTMTDGTDWTPCTVCADEAKMIVDVLTSMKDNRADSR